MDKDGLDFRLLQQLRDGFIAPAGTLTGDYWQSRHALEQYHATFAQRIGWKWDAVIQALVQRGLNAPSKIVDYGCGSGIASLKWTQSFATNEVTLFDRSALAVQFAQENLEQTVKGLKVATPRKDPPFENAFVLLSHVAGELSESALSALVAKLRTADGFCWVEPGTPQSSRTLISVRERLRPEMTALAPCPHQARCGLAAAVEARVEAKVEAKVESGSGLPATSDHHRSAWCHHFARTPAEVFRSGFWKRFSDEMGIDLRSLPTSFLVMQRNAKLVTKSHVGIGRPRFYKAYAHFWTCNESGVGERKIIERKNARLFGRLEENEFLSEWSAEELEGSTALLSK